MKDRGSWDRLIKETVAPFAPGVIATDVDGMFLLRNAQEFCFEAVLAKVVDGRCVKYEAVKVDHNALLSRPEETARKLAADLVTAAEALLGQKAS